MYPPQTSFVPIDVALAKFIEINGFFGNYPYWYLGSAKVNFLTGPVVPATIILLKKIGLAYFDASLFLVFLSFILFPLFWGYFAKVLSGNLKIGVAVAVVLALSPWHYVWLLAFGSVSSVLALCFVPLVLIFYLKRSKFSIFNFRFSILQPAIAFALLLLINIEAGIVAFVTLAILASVQERDWVLGIKQTFKILLLGIVLTMWWYFPSYYLNLIFAPSIGGRSVLGALSAAIGFFKNIVPLLLAIAVVKFGFGVRNKFLKFSAIFLGTFLILTIFRFISDYDFWLDWTSWIIEVEIGMAMVVAKIFAGPVSRFLPSSAQSELKSGVKLQNNADLRAAGNPSTTATRKLNLGSFGIWFLIIGVYILCGWYFAFNHKDFWLPRTNISRSAEYKVAEWLGKNVSCNQFESNDCQAVFLSGSSAFWLNSLVDVRQVRGGADQGSFVRDWREITWSLREGDLKTILPLLSAYNIDYIVVHTDESGEFYHDFSNAYKFQNNSKLELVWEDSGDMIYRVSR